MSGIDGFRLTNCEDCIKELSIVADDLFLFEIHFFSTFVLENWKSHGCVNSVLFSIRSRLSMIILKITRLLIDFGYMELEYKPKILTPRSSYRSKLDPYLNFSLADIEIFIIDRVIDEIISAVRRENFDFVSGEKFQELVAMFTDIVKHVVSIEYTSRHV